MMVSWAGDHVAAPLNLPRCRDRSRSKFSLDRPRDLGGERHCLDHVRSVGEQMTEAVRREVDDIITFGNRISTPDGQ